MKGGIKGDPQEQRVWVRSSGGRKVKTDVNKLLENREQSRARGYQEEAENAGPEQRLQGHSGKAKGHLKSKSQINNKPCTAVLINVTGHIQRKGRQMRMLRDREDSVGEGFCFLNLICLLIFKRNVSTDVQRHQFPRRGWCRFACPHIKIKLAKLLAYLTVAF